MERNIVRSKLMLSRPCDEATQEDRSIGQDLLDTLAAHTAHCVGMAANMIGERKRIIVVADGSRTLLMYNPVIIEKSGPFQTEEGCLSLEGRRPTTRYRKIRVRYQDEDFVERTKNYAGWTAQIIQHEVDHCNGVVI